MEQKGHVGDVLVGIFLYSFPVEYIQCMLKIVVYILGYVYGRWKNWLTGAPAPDYLRFDARLVSFWASRGPRDCAPELCGESSLQLNHRYATSKRITTV